MVYLVLAPPVAVVVRVTEDSASRGLIIPLIIQTIRLDRFRSVWTDEAPNLSSPDRSGADQTNAEHQATDLAVGVRISADDVPEARPGAPAPASLHRAAVW
jgi:hypothetical protein